MSVDLTQHTHIHICDMNIKYISDHITVDININTVKIIIAPY